MEIRLNAHGGISPERQKIYLLSYTAVRLIRLNMCGGILHFWVSDKQFVAR